ncbi:MAG: hypothetical protein HOH43_26285 [Candidatus Latescibacteria bacterium]|nr:hypothetical protein [Candidatus Latescibacterota bacterium]
MDTIDYQRSFLTFRIDTLKKKPQTVAQKPPYTLNNARIPLDSRCIINEKATGRLMSFVLGVSCKTEQVGVDEGIWHDPNADFKPVCSVSGDQFMALKAFDVANKGVMLYPPSLGNQPERQIIKAEETFDSLNVDLTEVTGRIMTSAEEIVEAVLGNRLINARTEIESDRYTAVIEYPVKTINANERDYIYQPDTGPVLFPDMNVDPDDLIGGFDVAFVAFNTPHWAEFIVRVPTSISDEIEVHHYSRSIRLEACNAIIELP